MSYIYIYQYMFFDLYHSLTHYTCYEIMEVCSTGGNIQYWIILGL